MYKMHLIRKKENQYPEGGFAAFFIFPDKSFYKYFRGYCKHPLFQAVLSVNFAHITEKMVYNSYHIM